MYVNLILRVTQWRYHYDLHFIVEKMRHRLKNLLKTTQLVKQ